MPVVTIQAPPPKESASVDRMLAATAKALASALETTESNVWVNFSPMAAVREGAATGAPNYHPIVTILANPRPKELTDRGLAAAAKAVAAGLAVPLERVWIHWIVLEQGRVFADGVIK